MSRLDWGRDRARSLSRELARSEREAERASKRLERSIVALSRAVDRMHGAGVPDGREAHRWARQAKRKGPVESKPWSDLELRARELRRQSGLLSGAARAELVREAEELERQAYEMALAARTVLPAAPDKK